MRILGMNFGQSKPTQPAIVQPPKTETRSLSSMVMEFSRPIAPSIKENEKTGWVEYSSEGSFFPQVLLDLLDSCALHSGIVAGKAFLVAGGKIKVDGMPYDEWIKTATLDQSVEVRAFIENSYGENWNDLKSMLATDYEISGQFALEVIWSMDFSRIAEVKYIPFNCVVPAVKEDGKVNAYYYHKDWVGYLGKKRGRTEPVKVQAFNIDSHVPESENQMASKEILDRGYEHRQILFVKNSWPGYEYFGRPVYQGALRDVSSMATLSMYYMGSVENGFTPSVAITIHQKNGTDEQVRAIGRNLEKQFTNKGNGRKLVVLFSDNKENAPTIQPLDVKNLDDQMVALQEHLSTNIVTGHGVTSPELVGVSVPGLLGTGDIATKWSIFDKTCIQPNQAVIERTMNLLASINGIKQTLSFEDINPLPPAKP